MPSLTRRAFGIGTALLGLPHAAAGQAAAWPSRPVTVVMPLQAGSASDVALRLLLDRLSERSGHRFVIENVTGAAGIIGAARAASAPADGYTLAALNNSILTILPNVQTRKLGFDPFTSFVAIAGIATIPTFLGVHKDVPVRTVPELLAFLAAQQGDVTYASGGSGSPQHLATEMFLAMTGTRMTQVPYRGAPAAATDLAGGHVQVMFIAHSLALPFLPSGNIRLIGFAGPERHEAFPELPTVAEQGVAGFDYSSWIGLYALAGTPAPIVTRLREYVAAALTEPSLRERLSNAGLALWAKTPAELDRALVEDDRRWKAVVRQADIKI